MIKKKSIGSGFKYFQMNNFVQDLLQNPPILLRMATPQMHLKKILLTTIMMPLPCEICDVFFVQSVEKIRASVLPTFIEQ